MANDTTVTRIVETDEEIWLPSERDEKGQFLTDEEQMGVVQLNLLKPLKLSDREEPLEHLLVVAPSTRQILDYTHGKGNDARREVNFFGSCCQGINPKDVEELHSKDWGRLGRLVTHFTV